MTYVRPDDEGYGMLPPFASVDEATERLERNGHPGLAESVRTGAMTLSEAADAIGAMPTYGDAEGRELPDRLRATDSNTRS